MSTVYGNLIPTLIVVAAMFIVINYALSLVARIVERRLKRAQRTVGPVAGGAGPAAPGMSAVPHDAVVEGPLR